MSLAMNFMDDYRTEHQCHLHATLGDGDHDQQICDRMQKIESELLSFGNHDVMREWNAHKLQYCETIRNLDISEPVVLVMGVVKTFKPSANIAKKYLRYGDVAESLIQRCHDHLSKKHMYSSISSTNIISKPEPFYIYIENNKGAQYGVEVNNMLSIPAANTSVIIAKKKNLDVSLVTNVDKYNVAIPLEEKNYETAAYASNVYRDVKKLEIDGRRVQQDVPFEMEIFTSFKNLKKFKVGMPDTVTVNKTNITVFEPQPKSDIRVRFTRFEMDNNQRINKILNAKNFDENKFIRLKIKSNFTNVVFKGSGVYGVDPAIQLSSEFGGNVFFFTDTYASSSTVSEIKNSNLIFFEFEKYQDIRRLRCIYYVTSHLGYDVATLSTHLPLTATTIESKILSTYVIENPRTDEEYIDYLCATVIIAYKNHLQSNLPGISDHNMIISLFNLEPPQLKLLFYPTYKTFQKLLGITEFENIIDQIGMVNFIKGLERILRNKLQDAVRKNKQYYIKKLNFSKYTLNVLLKDIDPTVVELPVIELQSTINKKVVDMNTKLSEKTNISTPMVDNFIQTSDILPVFLFYISLVYIRREPNVDLYNYQMKHIFN